MANQDRVNFVWAESALTTIPPIPVSEVAYRDTTQTPEQMEVGQQYDTIYNSARYNQLLFLLTSVAKTLCENGIMPFLAGQEYSQYARCIFTDGKVYYASRAIEANESPYPTPKDDSDVWITEDVSENFVPISRRVIAGTGLTGGGPLSSDVTLSAKVDGKTTQAAADGAITVKDVAIGGNLEDLASARGQVGDARQLADLDFNMLTVPGFYRTIGNPKNGPIGISGASIGSLFVSGTQGNGNRLFQIMVSGNGIYWRTSISGGTTWEIWNQVLTGNKIGDGIRNTNGIISVPEMQGATASAAGTSGLVPPAAAGQQESFLTGGGEYKPALPLTGGTMLGSIQCGNPAQFVVGTQEAPFYQMRARIFGVHSPAGVLCGIMTADAADNYFSIEPTGGAIVNSYCGRPGSAFQHGYFANMNGHPLAATIIGGSSGDGWLYRKYSDGFIEQWGIARTTESGDTIITFPTPFLNGIYNIQLSSVSPAYQNDFYNVSMQAYSYSTTSFYVEMMNGQTKRLSAPFAWYACGF